MTISYEVCNERGQHQDDGDDAQRLSNAADVTVLHSRESKGDAQEEGRWQKCTESTCLCDSTRARTKRQETKGLGHERFGGQIQGHKLSLPFLAIYQRYP